MSRKNGFSDSSDEFEHSPQASQGIGDDVFSMRQHFSGDFAVGQCFASDMEPELGIGTLSAIENKRLSITFKETSSVRHYSTHDAPLRRIRFKHGDIVQNQAGKTAKVLAVLEEHSLITYQTTIGTIHETDLSGSTRFTAPIDRLLSGHFDRTRVFDLRMRALELRHELDKSEIRGFCGPRIDCLGHQLYIAHQIAQSHKRRVMLADEVGLGKTIEACLILHRLLLCGLAQRALICVPQSIVHVWFVELLRKFNMLFTIVDASYFDDDSGNEQNPFLSDQLVLCDIGFLSQHEKAASLALEAGWDVLIVDEAHHVRHDSPLFDFVQSLALVCRDVFLLTATPHQLGEESHFARLRLLDPSRFTTFETFKNESKTHRTIARITSSLTDNVQPGPADTTLLCGLFADEAVFTRDQIEHISAQSPTIRQRMVDELIDRFGIGRAMFRNTRTAVGNFPKRIADILPLDGNKSCIDQSNKELQNQFDTLTNDPRLLCFIELLNKFPDDKFLCICRDKSLVIAIEKAMRHHCAVATGQFHEELTLVARDRNAAWFGEDDGARVLLCSEIGSEGRNFQFCHHLFMWDLPYNCELIEQRIGRLDRIGQKHEVFVHVPYIKGAAGEILCRFFHEGLNVFQNIAPYGQEVFELCNPALEKCIRGCVEHNADWKSDLDLCISSAKKQAAVVSKRLESGRDRLLELHSFRPAIGNRIVESIAKSEKDKTLEQFMIDFFKFYGVFSEPLGNRTYKLWSESGLDETFPALRTDRPLVTFDRAKALSREDMEFMTADHPAVRNGLDMFLGSEKGNCSCAIWKNAPCGGLLWEARYVLECVASPLLHVDRFLAPTPIRILIDHMLRDKSNIFSGESFNTALCDYDKWHVLEQNKKVMDLIPKLQQHADECAVQCARNAISRSLDSMKTTLSAEKSRVEHLAEVNPAVSKEELITLETEITQLTRAIETATPRLDAVRLVVLQKKTV